MNDISGFGLRINIKASVTFPNGFNITQLADDADPLDFPSIQIVDKAMGLNGDLLTWSKASPLPVTLNVVPNSEDDKNLAVLLEANRVGKGKSSARDEITLTVVYPDETTATLTAGKITDGTPGRSVGSSGRLKSRGYTFVFENKVEA